MSINLPVIGSNDWGDTVNNNFIDLDTRTTDNYNKIGVLTTDSNTTNTNVSNHIADAVKHITVAERTAWNAMGTQYYTGYLTRSLNAVGGNQSITGLGFKPKAVIIFANVVATNIASWGMHTQASGTNNGIMTNYNGVAGNFASSGRTIFLCSSSSAWQSATIASYDTDGFTLAWTPTGTPPSGTIELNYIAFK